MVQSAPIIRELIYEENIASNGPTQQIAKSYQEFLSPFWKQGMERVLPIRGSAIEEREG
jgi:hypothetical protein